MKHSGLAILLAASSLVLVRGQDTTPQDDSAPTAQSPNSGEQKDQATKAADDMDTRDKIFYSDDTERIKPLTTKLIHNIIMDQKDIWTSPFHMKKRDVVAWSIIGAGIGGLIASDKYTSKDLPNTVDQVSFSRHVSNIGAVYTVLPVTASFYVGGAILHNAKMRETGILAGESVLDSLIVVGVLKTVMRRARPLEADGTGPFFYGGDSFPSGHAAESWALASVIAHEYHTKIAYISAYGLATLISFSRVSGRNHFPSDILAGSAIGWYLGRYVVHTHAEHYAHMHRSKISELTPRIAPQFDAASGTRGVVLSWGH